MVIKECVTHKTRINEISPGETRKIEKNITRNAPPITKKTHHSKQWGRSTGRVRIKRLITTKRLIIATKTTISQFIRFMNIIC